MSPGNLHLDKIKKAIGILPTCIKSIEDSWYELSDRRPGTENEVAFLRANLWRMIFLWTAKIFYLSKEIYTKIIKERARSIYECR
jgi:hypothetical protein